MKEARDFLHHMKETAKALENFGPGQTPRELIRAYGEVKLAALRAQQRTASLYREKDFQILEEVLQQIIGGDHDELFPLDLRQGGAGTSLHMNICEAAVYLLKERLGDKTEVDSLDHLAKFQSTNDTLPTAVTLVIYRGLQELEESVVELQEQLVELETKWQNLLITGRTQLQAALPITLGQVFAGWAGSIERDRWRISKLKERVRQIPLGGTAMGTCFSAPRNYVFQVETELKALTGLPLCRSQNLTNGVSAQDHYAEIASGYGQLAGNLYKISGDLLLYSAGFTGEIQHPQLQYGSTIMPFKTNPVLLEQIRGLTIDMEYETEKLRRFSREGQLQLNAYLPFLLHSFLNIHNSMMKTMETLQKKLLTRIKVNEQRCEENLIKSGALINALLPRVGYRNLKEIHQSLKNQKELNRTELVEFIASELSLPAQKIEQWLDQREITSYYKEK